MRRYAWDAIVNGLAQWHYTPEPYGFTLLYMHTRVVAMAQENTNRKHVSEAIEDVKL